MSSDPHNPCQVIHTIRDTPPNPSGLLALSTDSSHCYLAYPGIHQNLDDAHDHVSDHGNDADGGYD